MRKLFFISFISLLLLGCSKENSNNISQKEIPEIQTKKTVEKTADLSVKNPDNVLQKETPEIQCKKAVIKIMKLMLSDPIMNQMSAEAVNKLNSKETEEKNIQDCIKEYKQETIDCVMKTENLTDIQKCK